MYQPVYRNHHIQAVTSLGGGNHDETEECDVTFALVPCAHLLVEFKGTLSHILCGSTKVDAGEHHTAAAGLTIATWKQIEDELEVARPIMEWKVHG